MTTFWYVKERGHASKKAEAFATKPDLEVMVAKRASDGQNSIDAPHAENLHHHTTRSLHI